MFNQYEGRLIPFAVEMGRLTLSPREIAVFREFQEGRRKGLGFSAWNAMGLARIMQLTSAAIAWRTLCYPKQLTAILSRSQPRGAEWIDGFAQFVTNADSHVRDGLRFSAREPRITTYGDEFWRIMAMGTSEGEIERIEPHLTNAVYYDFEHVPAWIIKAASDALKSKPSSMAFSIAMREEPRQAHPTEPTGYSEWSPDEADDD